MNGIAYLRRGKVNRSLVKSNSAFVVGIDGGGTKTLGVAVDLEGNVLSVVKRGGSNYQSVGRESAFLLLKDLLSALVYDSGRDFDQCGYVSFALSGADRDKDFEAIASFLSDIDFLPPFVLCNDSLAALWTATNGIGVALVAGTGSNCIGVNYAGNVAKVGGLGPLSGDVGFGEDIAMKAIAAAIKANDGRGEPTLLEDLFCKRMGIERIEDIIEFWFADSFNPPNIGSLAPLVFDAASQNDEVAYNIIYNAGLELGNNASVAAKRLGWTGKDSINFVFGGSLLQKPKPPLLADAARDSILNNYPKASIIIPKIEPVVGAVSLSLHEFTGDLVGDDLKTKIGNRLADIL